MNRTRACLWIMLISLVMIPCLPAALTAAGEATLFVDAIKDYNTGDYGKSVEKFQALVKKGIVNPKLYYNLANAYFKSGDLGRAVLWYEKAYRTMPGDPDLLFNRDYALSLVKDSKKEELNPVSDIIFFWKDMIPPKIVKWSALGFNLLFWSILIISLYKNKRAMRVPRNISLALLILFAGTALLHYYNDRFSRKGVILGKTVSVRSGISSESTELFKLHAGTRVIIQRERETHFRIFFEEGKIGWVEKSDAGVI